MINRQQLKARLLARVTPEKKLDGCWLQTSHLKKDTGYGIIYIDGKKIYSHKLSYEIYNGKVPPGFHIHHDCENRNCVNPGHLKAIKPGEHPRISARKGVFKGEKNRNAKFSNDTIRNLKILADFGFTAKKLAEIFGISSSHTRAILRGDRRREC